MLLANYKDELECDSFGLYLGYALMVRLLRGVGVLWSRLPSPLILGIDIEWHFQWDWALMVWGFKGVGVYWSGLPIWEADGVFWSGICTRVLGSYGLAQSWGYLVFAIQRVAFDSCSIIGNELCLHQISKCLSLGCLLVWFILYHHTLHILLREVIRW